MAGKSFFFEEFPSTADAMRAAVTSALSALDERDWIAPDKRYFAHLCLEEAIVNAIHHGNKGDQSLSFSLEMKDEGPDCRIIVRDRGSGFHPDKVEKPPADSFGGRGVFLMKSFMKQVTFNEATQSLEMVMPKQKQFQRTKR